MALSPNSLWDKEVSTLSLWRCHCVDNIPLLWITSFQCQISQQVCIAQNAQRCHHLSRTLNIKWNSMSKKFHLNCIISHKSSHHNLKTNKLTVSFRPLSVSEPFQVSGQLCLALLNLLLPQFNLFLWLVDWFKADFTSWHLSTWSLAPLKLELFLI